MWSVDGINWRGSKDSIDREQYEEDLRRRQQEHLDGLQRHTYPPWRPCLHDQCIECVGTGLKRDGSICVHYLSCPCPKCSPTYM